MKKIIILLVFLFVALPSIFPQNFSGKKQILTSEEPARSLRQGETLEYDVEWLGVPIGTITLNTDGIKKINGHDCYDISARAKPNRFFSRFYEVEYIVHTYVDKNNFCTHRFEKIRRVRDKSTQTVINFDWQELQADFIEEGDAPSVVISPISGKIGEKIQPTTKLLAGTQDLFSSLYYLRLFDLKENQSYSLNIYYGQRNWPVRIEVSKPFLREMRKTGSFVSLRATIRSDLNEFILGRNELIVYFTSDSRRIPIEFKFGSGLSFVRGKIKNIKE